MVNLNLTPAKLVAVLAIGVVPLGIARPSLAQTPVSTPQEFVTVCAYDPSSGQLNPLGMRAFITVSEVEGNSIFRFEQFPDFVSGTSDTLGRPAEIASERTLTLYETPLAEARQLLIDEPTYYAALLGVESEQLTGDGFSEVNETLACQEVSDASLAGVPQPPQIPDPPTAQPTPSLMIGDLPDGNYRVASATYPFRVVSDEELVENGGALFLFRKRGNSITGNFSYIDSEISACVTGTLAARNAILGRASVADKTDVVTDAETGVAFLGPAEYLQLGENVSGDRYESSILTLEGFSRINAGPVLPPESCP